MKKIYNIKISTILLVALPILSIFIGYFGVKLFLLSNNNYDDTLDVGPPGVEEIIEGDADNNIEENSNGELIPGNQESNQDVKEEKMTSKKIDGITFYSVQVGSFSNNENASQFKDELSIEGFYSFVTKESNYKVFVQVSYDKVFLENNMEKIREYSADAFIKNVNLESKIFSYVVKDTNYFNEMATMIASQINSLESSVDLTEIKNKLNSIEELNSKFMNVDENNENIGNKITKYISDIKGEISNMNSNSDEEVRLLLEKNIELFLKYFS